MKNKTYKEKIRQLNGQVLQDITDTARAAGQFQFIYDPDAPVMNTCLRFYNGSKYPEKLAVESMYINDNDVLEFFTEDGRRFTVDKMHSADVSVLNKGVEMVEECDTPAKFVSLLNKLKNFPIVLYSIMDRRGWYDLTDEDGNENNICWCPAEKTLITEDADGKATTRKKSNYESLEMDWHHAEEWFHQSDFVTMERISGFKQFDFSDEDGSQDFVDAVENWWATLGKTEKIRIWNENK